MEVISETNQKEKYHTGMESVQFKARNFKDIDRDGQSAEKNDIKSGDKMLRYPEGDDQINGEKDSGLSTASSGKSKLKRGVA